MIVTIDCRMLDSSGIGVYLWGCLPYFIQTGREILLLGNLDRLNTFSQNDNVKILACDVKPFSLRELFFFPAKTARRINKTDAFYSPFFNIPCGIKVPVYTTIHDIIFPDMPELTSKAGLAARMFFFRRAYKKSQKIFTVSEFSKSRIRHHLGKNKPVIVTYTGIRQAVYNYKSNDKSIKKTETIVFIGNIKKHKGLNCLLDAFHFAKKEGLPHKLIIIGERNNFRTSDNAVLQKIESLGDESVMFTGFVSDEQLMEYVSQASLLVQPSLYEGFGLPPLEAMVLGTPALISDIPVFKEIYSDFPVIFFQAGNPHDLRDKLLDILHNKTPALSLPSHLTSQYSFQKTTAIILQNLTLPDQYD